MQRRGDANDEISRGVALALLSSAAGSMDALAFLTLGDVFTSAMTGNTILLGIALGQGRMSAAPHSLIAVVGYAVGVAVAAVPLTTTRPDVERALALEIIFLTGFAGLWIVCGGPTSPPAIYGLIIISAVAMGLQGAVGRAIHISGIPTTVITSTLTAVLGTVAERLLAGVRPLTTGLTRQQTGTLLTYLASAVATGFAVSRWLPALPFAPLVAVLVLTLGLRFRFLKLC